MDQRETRPHVLVVDDESETLELARTLLEPEGYGVDTAADGRLGLAAARAKFYDVIVLDITMPHMDGIELGNALRANPSTANSMIIVHSALNEAWVRSFFAGYDLFLTKPDESGQLTTAVGELLQGRELHRGKPTPE